MRRCLLLGMALVLVAVAAFTSRGVQAQLFPSGPGSAPSGMPPILDVRVKVGAGAKTEGHCLVLESGKLDLSARLAGDPPYRTVELTFYRVRGGDDHLTTFDQALSAEALTRQGDVVGGMYCYGLKNKEPIPPQVSMNEITALGQDVVLRVGYVRSQ